MRPTLSPQEFVAKWRDSDFKERSFYQEHFIDLCRLVGHPTPIEYGQKEVFSYVILKILTGELCDDVGGDRRAAVAIRVARSWLPAGYRP